MTITTTTERNSTITVNRMTTEPETLTTAKSRTLKRPANWTSIAILTMATFLAVFALLAIRMQSGFDPAIGSAASRQNAQLVVKRRLIVERKVIHETIDPAETGESAANPAGQDQAQSSASSSSAPAPAPVTRAS